MGIRGGGGAGGRAPPLALALLLTPGNGCNGNGNSSGGNIGGVATVVLAAQARGLCHGPAARRAGPGGDLHHAGADAAVELDYDGWPGHVRVFVLRPRPLVLKRRPGLDNPVPPGLIVLRTGRCAVLGWGYGARFIEPCGRSGAVPVREYHRPSASRPSRGVPVLQDPRGEGRRVTPSGILIVGSRGGVGRRMGWRGPEELGATVHCNTTRPPLDY